MDLLPDRLGDSSRRQTKRQRVFCTYRGDRGRGTDGRMFDSCVPGRHHLELESIPGQNREFYKCDGKIKSLWGEHYI
jgi:hypothetical protein